MRVLIAGGGQVAALIASRLVREGNDLVIVEPNPERCTQLDAQLDARIVQGSAARLATMREAGIAAADLVIAVTDSDEVNLLACLIAHAEAPRSVRVARVRTHEAGEWRHVMAQSQIRIDQIIHPETDIADLVTKVIGFPHVSDIREFAGGAVTLFGMTVPERSWMDGKTLVEIGRAAPAASALIAMIFRGQQVIIPRGSDVVLGGDHLYVLTNSEHLGLQMRFLGLDTEQRLRRVLILGGKQVGILIAQRLEAQGVSVKLFERDPQRTEKIAGLLRRSVVVNADGTDQRVLEEEGLVGADAFLALTNHDEDNIIASMLARRLGVKKVIPLINRLNYLPMVQRLGVSTTVSLRVAAVDRILQFVRRGRVLSVTTFRDEEAEAIELLAGPESRFVGKPMRDANFPKDTVVGALVRPSGEVIV
ncbi:MAG: Trk system potassium transporter TrkA, partial [Vicinamibacterales bacterium]|nr:Trk system potassium transporter TrkA [Vicinamibacterales bacterium]